MDKMVIEQLNEADMSAAWLDYERLKPIWTRVEKRLKEVGRYRGFQLSDGRSVGEDTWLKSDVNMKRAFGLLRECGVGEDTLASLTTVMRIPVCKVFAAPKVKKSKKSLDNT